MSSRDQNQFLLYTAPNGPVKVEVFFKNETVWLTQKALAELFGVKVPAINKRLKNIFESGELGREATVSKMEIVRSESRREAMNALTTILPRILPFWQDSDLPEISRQSVANTKAWIEGILSPFGRDRVTGCSGAMKQASVVSILEHTAANGKSGRHRYRVSNHPQMSLPRTTRESRHFGRIGTEQPCCGRNPAKNPAILAGYKGSLGMAEAAPCGTASLLLQHMVDELQNIYTQTHGRVNN